MIRMLLLQLMIINVLVFSTSARGHSPVLSTLTLFTANNAKVNQNFGHSASSTVANFKTKDSDPTETNSKNDNNNGIWGVFSKFISPINRAKVTKSYNSPSTNSNLHYHLRLKDPVCAKNAPRHVITRIVRYFPDISFDGAKQIVLKAQEEGVALIRICSSLSEAQEALELFRRADPPIICDIYDSKTEEIVPY